MKPCDKPNIVFIMADDMGYWAMGCAGNREIRTPNLDRLAASGIRFTNFFCASPVCSPARASILTGAIPSRHGVLDWIRGGSLDKGLLPESLKYNKEYETEDQPVEYLRGQLSYTDLLAAHGYYCALSGKWHLGDSMNPQKGFSHWFTIGRGGCAYYSPDIVENGSIRAENRYVTDLITEDALAVLEQLEQTRQGGPFYMSVHYTAPHSPWDSRHHPQNILDSYDSCPFDSVPIESPHPWQTPSCPRGEGERRKELLKGYFTAITAMDAGIGRLLDKLEAMGARDNTLVVFTSDNGMNMGHHGIWGKGNGTFPQNMFDTSVKVPMLMSQPGRIAAGAVSDALLSHYDLFPTLLAYAGLDIPDMSGLPGKSFAALSEDPEYQQGLPDEERIFIGDEYGPVRMVRTREWKYVHRYPYGPHELYHLQDDPEERANLIDDVRYAGQAAKLRTVLETWFLAYADPARDGTREPVTGYGQLHLAGPAGEGRQAFMPLRKPAE